MSDTGAGCWFNFNPSNFEDRQNLVGPLASAFEKSLRLSGHRFSVSQFALPNDEHLPASVVEAELMKFVAFNISLKFRSPIILVRSWNAALRAITMLMPEATMNKNHFPPRRKDNVWFAWEIFSMHPESVAHLVKEAP